MSFPARKEKASGRNGRPVIKTLIRASDLNDAFEWTAHAEHVQKVREAVPQSTDDRLVTHERRKRVEAGCFDRALLAYGRGGQGCVRCGTAIEKVTVGGRGTHFCPVCQKLPRYRQHPAPLCSIPPFSRSSYRCSRIGHLERLFTPVQRAKAALRVRDAAPRPLLGIDCPSRI